MRLRSFTHRGLSWLLTLSLILSSGSLVIFADGKSGKKSFKEGVKHEDLQQWDLAAQQFALAVAAEPGNPEYKLHYLKALQNASLMFIKRGDELAKQGDYASAYNAFRQALGYDPSNEMASLKMRNMLTIQKDQALGEGGYTYDPKSGNIKPINNIVKVAAKPKSRDLVQDIIFKDIEFKDCVKNLARSLDLNVLFDESVRVQGKIQVELRGVTMAKAFDLILMQNKMTFEQVDRKTILVYADNTQTRQKFERAAVKTFYLGNIKIADARNVLNSLIPGRPVGTIEDQKMIILKGTPSELQLVQDILDSVDKNISEVVVDVEIYEVSHTTARQIGNQLATGPVTFKEGTKDKDGNPTSVAVVSAGLSALGGVGMALAGLGGNNLINAFGSSGTGAVLGLPPTTLSLLQSNNNSKLLARTQVHALDGQQNQTKVGQSVPVRTGTNYGVGGYGGLGTQGVGGVGGVGGVNPTLNQGLGGFGGNGLFDNIQYKDVGLVIDITPKITNEGYVEVKMKLETSNVQGTSSSSSSSGANLTPTFTQRSLSTTARIQDGVTSIVASVSQERRNDGRESIPVIGMVPILGRFFTSPKEEKDNSDIIITVTPHIIRPTEITKEDNLARLAGALTSAGGQGSGLPASIEDVLNRAQEDEEQERRLIAQERGLAADPAANTTVQTSAQIAPGTAPSAPATLRNVSSPLPDNGLPAGPSGTANTYQPAGNSSESKPPRKSIVIQGDPNSPSSSQNEPPPTGQQADVVAPPPVEPAPVIPDPATLNSAGGNPTLPGGAANTMIPPGGVNPTIPGSVPNPNGAVQPGGETGLVGPAGVVPGQPRAEGDKPADITENTQPQVKPAQVMGATRPPHVEKWIQEQRLKMLKEQEEAKKASKQPAARNQAPAEMTVPQSTGQAAAPRAVLTSAANGAAFDGAGAPTPMRIEAPKAGTLALTLSAGQSRVQMNKAVAVTVQVDAQSVMSSANLAVRFDPAKLQVKSVRDGDMLGKQSDITHTVENGVLIINAGAGGGKAGKASGRLLVIEFTAVGEGQAQIAVERGESQIKLTNNTVAVITATPAQLTVVR